MFMLRATTDDRTRACTATARQAIRQLDRMMRDGLAPIVTDGSGRRLSVSDLERRAAPDKSDGMAGPFRR